jgi:hypothetical protein
LLVFIPFAQQTVYNIKGPGARTNCIPDFKHDFARRAVVFSLQAAAMFKPTPPLLSGLLW